MLLLAGLCALLGLSFRLLLRTEMSAVSMVAGVETARVTKENGVGSIARQTERPLIVIDAGHGGMDGGALSADGISEKDINLAIALALQEEIRAYPADVLMTRSVDEGLYTEKSASICAKKREDLLRRGEILNAESVTLGISIHLNSFPQDEKVYGAQVFYPKARAEGTDVSRACEQSKRYAEAIQKSLETSIFDGREREAMPKDDILLFHSIRRPRVLVECGFLSNHDECERLKTAEYQRQAARAIWEGVNEILCLKKNKNVTVIDSANKA